MRRIAAVIVVLALGIVLPQAIGAPTSSPAGGVRAQLELNQQFFYIGDPLNVRISITNRGAAEVGNPVKSPLFGSFSISDASGKKLTPQAKPDAQEPARPAKLAPSAFYGAAFDLSQSYPQLRTKGRFSIHWAADGVFSDEIVVTVIPRFEPSKDYSAKVETEEGTFTIDLLKRTAPIAVKAFVDLANAGFYDGLLFHEARGDQLVSGGDPTGTGNGQAPLRYPAELNPVPIVAGSVLLKPAPFPDPDRLVLFLNEHGPRLSEQPQRFRGAARLRFGDGQESQRFGGLVVHAEPPKLSEGFLRHVLGEGPVGGDGEGETEDASLPRCLEGQLAVPAWKRRVAERLEVVADGDGVAAEIDNRGRVILTRLDDANPAGGLFAAWFVADSERPAERGISLR
jgi:hypothetical protein